MDLLRIPWAALLHLVCLTGCRGSWLEPDFPKPAAEPTTVEDEPKAEVRREYQPDDSTKLRREWSVLVWPGGRLLLHGVERVWHQNGVLASEREHARGQPIGTWRTWSPAGVQLSELIFAGNEAREMRWWHPNGQLSSSGPAIRGLRTGAWTEWHDDGSRAAQGEYHEGLRQGPWRYFARDGTLLEQGTFERGVKSGEWWRAPPSAGTPQ